MKSIDKTEFSLDLSEAFNTEPQSHMDRVPQYNTKLLFRKQESVLPPTRPISVLAEDSSEFFQTKIDNIIEKLCEKATDLDSKYIETNFQTNCRMNKFFTVM